MGDPRPRVRDGYLDILTLPAGHGDDAAAANKDVLKNVAPTSSYERGHYDKQRVIVPELDGDAASLARNAVWKTFERYIADGIPLKIADWNSMRESKSSSSATDVVDSEKSNMSCSAIPDIGLRSKITVQCKPESATRVAAEQQNVGSSEANKRRKVMLQSVDAALSVTGRSGNESNLFLGQEDQLTTQMDLGDVLSGKYNSDMMQVCVAQETIVSSPETDLSSSIDIQTNGVVNKRGAGEGQGADEPLSALASWVRAPAYLLPNDNVHVREINLWYAPNESRTNTHYDGNHNILIVLRGSKTVELCPPGTIRGSPIHSEHANHPVVLRSTDLGGSCSITPSLSSELGSTRDRINKSTTVASISAGEALFIPEGWWHRVESSADCLAVNFWFDHAAYSVSALARPSNQHMLPFQARETVRLYVDANFDRVAKALLQEAMQGGSDSFLPSSHQKKMGVNKIDKHLEQMVLGTDFGKDNSKNVDWKAVREQGYTDEDIRICFSNITREADELQRDADAEQDPDCAEAQMSMSRVDGLGCLISIFLVHIRPEREADRRAVIHLLRNMFPPFDMGWGELSSCTSKWLFLEVVLRLQKPACYILSQVWELHKPASEAESSYNAFFASCFDDSGRKHILEQVETFKQDVTKRLLLDDLMLLNTSASGRDIVETDFRGVEGRILASRGITFEDLRADLGF